MHPQPLFVFELFGKKFTPTLYGLCIAVGILMCLLVYYFYTKKSGVPEKVQDYVFFVAVFAIAFGFLAAKLYQAFYDFIENGVFDFYNSGITAMGGFIGGAVAFLIIYFGFARFVFKGKDEKLHLKHFNTTFRAAPCCIVIAHAFGRIGCLMAGCCHGKFVSSEYTFGTVIRGAYSQYSGRVTWLGYYIPVQLYEALFLFALFAVLSVMFFKKSNITMHVYLIAYGIWRIFIEFFRADARGAMVLGLAPSQWQSLLFIAIGVILFIIYIVNKIPFFVKDKGVKDEDN